MAACKMSSYIFFSWYMACFFKFGVSLPATEKNKTTANISVLSKRLIVLGYENITHPGIYERLWPTRIIYYRFDPVFNTKDKSMVRNVMDSISTQACVKFEEILADDDTTFHVKIIAGDGCYTEGSGKMGTYLDPDTQIKRNFMYLSLQKNLCLNRMSIAHELFHALGFEHEFTRPDRDRYVNIMEENVQEHELNQFTINDEDESVTFGFDYDYNSIMHYDAYAFTKSSDKPTIIPTDPTRSYTSIGQREKPTDSDYFKLNALYECKHKDSPASPWSVWGPCTRQLDGNFTRIRQRFCSHKNISKCWPGNNRIQTVEGNCSVGPRLGLWELWETWSYCDIPDERIFPHQERTRICNGERCRGPDTQSRSCRKDGKVRGENDCTFEKDICRWHEQSPSKRYQWKSKIGKGEVMRDGPLFDHTTMGDSGYFLKAVNLNNARGEDEAILTMVILSNPHDTCLTFWYYMTGSENHALIVETRALDGTIIEGCEKKLELTTTTSSGEDWWIPAQINHNCGDAAYQVSFIASNGGDKFSNIAVDDIFFLDGYRAKYSRNRQLRRE